MLRIKNLILALLLSLVPVASRAELSDSIAQVRDLIVPVYAAPVIESVEVTGFDILEMNTQPPVPQFPNANTIYAYPYSMDFSMPDWHRMWINTSVLSGAFVSTLFVLECLPENATSWNRAELQHQSPAVRWFKNVFKRGPEWDHDNPIFNYILHPYAGAVYFMSARSTGFNFWQSMLYSATISTVGWEFGIEACMERPSIQDIFITPIIGSMMGEGFYHVKRYLVDHDYKVLGSSFLGGVTGFVVDPVNEIIDLFRGNPARRLAHSKANMKKGTMVESSFIPSVAGADYGFTVKVIF